MAKKTLHKGQWHFINAKGRLGDAASAFDPQSDTLYAEDGGFGDFAEVKNPEKLKAIIGKPQTIATLKSGQKEYRVVTQADQWFMGKFNPERLNALLNVLASEGWRLVAVTAADRATWFGSLGGTTRQEMVMFLERDVTADTPVTSYDQTLKDVL